MNAKTCSSCKSPKQDQSLPVDVALGGSFAETDVDRSVPVPKRRGNRAQALAKYLAQIAPTLCQIWDEGHRTVEAICRELNAREIPNAAGRKWSISTMHLALKTCADLGLGIRPQTRDEAGRRRRHSPLTGDRTKKAGSTIAEMERRLAALSRMQLAATDGTSSREVSGPGVTQAAAPKVDEPAQ